jgi:hypothetical protein
MGGKNVTRLILVHCVTGSLIVVHSEPRSSVQKSFPRWSLATRRG